MVIELDNKSDKYLVKSHGQQTFINANMVEKHKIDDSQLEKIKESWVEKHRLRKAIKDTNDPAELIFLAKQIKDLDFHLQDLWGFPRDENYHRQWDNPKCTCPKMDNDELWGNDHPIVNMECPLHGMGDPVVADWLSENSKRVYLIDIDNKPVLVFDNDASELDYLQQTGKSTDDLKILLALHKVYYVKYAIRTSK